MNPWRGLGGLSIEVWALCVATLINRAGTMAFPFLALYLTGRRGLSETQAGLVMACYGAGSLLSAPFAGRISDRVGPLFVMRGSLLVSGGLLLLFPLAANPVLIASLTLLWSATGEAYRAPTLALLADLAGPEQRKAAMSLNRLAINLGMSIGPAAGGLLAVVSFTAVFAVDGATSILAGLFLILAPPFRGRKPPEAAPSQSRAQALAIDRRLAYFLAAMLPVVIVFFQHASALPMFMVRNLGLSPAAFGLLLPVNTLLIVLLEVPLNLAMARWPHRQSLALGALLTALGFGALALVRGPAGVAATIVVWTLGEMILFPSAAAYVADISPSGRSGEFMGLYQMMSGAALTLAPWLGAATLETHGPVALWSGTFLAACASAALLARVR